MYSRLSSAPAGWSNKFNPTVTVMNSTASRAEFIRPRTTGLGDKKRGVTRRVTPLDLHDVSYMPTIFAGWSNEFDPTICRLGIDDCEPSSEFDSHLAGKADLCSRELQVAVAGYVQSWSDSYWSGVAAQV